MATAFVDGEIARRRGEAASTGGRQRRGSASLRGPQLSSAASRSRRPPARPSRRSTRRPARCWPRSRSRAQAEVERAVDAAKAGQPKWAAMTGTERGRVLKRVAEHAARAERRAGAARDPRYRQADPGNVGRRRALRRRLPRVFRRHRRRARRRAYRSRAVGLRLYAPRAARRRRRHRRLELSAPDRLLEGGAGARLRQRHDLQAGGTDAAHAP